MQCPGVAIEVRTHLIQNSQAGRLTKKMAILTPPTNSTLGGQSLTSVRNLSLLEDATKHTKRFKQTSLICSTQDGKVTTMLIDEMKRVYKAEVEAVLYCHEPLTHLLCLMVIAALTLWHPPMKSFIPQDTATIYSNYVYPLTSQLLLSSSNILAFCLGW